MGFLDRLKGKSDRLEDWKLKAAEKEAFAAEKQRRKEAAFNLKLEKARARGKAKAVPISERIGSGLGKVSSLVQSKSFQRYARAGASVSGRTPKKSTKKKGSKKRSTHSRQPDFSSMLLGY